MESLIILFSYHHNNTEKVAKVFSEVLDAEIRTPAQIDPAELQGYDLIGFGSGIYGAQHHGSLLNLADEMSTVADGKAFLFSTGGITGEKKVADDHSALRERLQSKGYTVIDDFQCVGFNTNSFLKYFGGMNKGRPNAEDLRDAEEFARGLMTSVGAQLEERGL